MTEIDNQAEEAVSLTGYEKFQFNIERAKELAEKIATKALDELAIRESMGTDLEGLVENLEEQDLRQTLLAPALNVEQDLYLSGALPTGRVMVKDEDVCLHCGLCAERCPTNAWDMQRSVVHIPQLGSFAE